MNKPSLGLQEVRRSYRQGHNGSVDVLKGVDLAIYPGELVALVGPSGAGKSTLLQIAGLLDAPTSGGVIIAERLCGALTERARTRLRRTAVGFVYQFHHLLPEFTAVENVMMPMRFTGVKRRQALAEANALLERMGLGRRARHLPAEMSGGEQQRVAIARALANRPRVLLADEPTGNLDPETSDHVFQELTAAARADGVAGLIATHNMELAARMDRIVRLEGGILTAG